MLPSILQTRSTTNRRVTRFNSRLSLEHLEDRRVLSTSAIADLPAESAAAHSRYAILGDDLTQLEDTLGDLGIRKIKSFKHIDGVAASLTASEADDLRSTLGSAFQLIRDQPIKATFELEPAKKGGGSGKPGGSGSGGQQTPWGIHAVNAPAAWQMTRGEGVAICVVDSGFDSDHPDLSGNIIAGANFIGNGTNWEDETGHATHVGGIVAALDNDIGVVGVAPNAKLIAAKVIGRRTNATHAELADAIRGCAVMRDQVDQAMPLVVNMSWSLSGGTSETWELVHDTIRELSAEGVVFSAAAGNWGHPCIAHPARWEEVYGVTAMNEDLSLWEDSAYGGSYNGQSCGPNTDPAFIAPGSGILSLWKNGATKTLDGTSMSTAYVSGVIALGLSVDSLGPLGTDIGLPFEQQGYGLIDALATVQNVDASLNGLAAALEIGRTEESNELSEGDSTEEGEGASAGVEYHSQAVDLTMSEMPLDSLTTSHVFSDENGSAASSAVDAEDELDGE